MNTDDLIEALARDARPVPAGRAARRIACCAALGLAATVAVVGLTLGYRPDLPGAAGDPAFVMRQAYTLSIAGFSAWLLLRLGQPGAPVRLPLAGLAATLVLVLGAVILEQFALSGPARLDAWLGQSWRSCTVSVGLIGLTATPFLFIATRRLAPARPGLAGFAAGLVAGAVAASAFGLYCTESAVSFLASWYTLGILATAAAGAMVGRYLLRW